MKKSSLRAFGIACFVIGLLLAFSEKINVPLVSSSETNTKEEYQTQIDQLQQQLTVANEQLAQLEQTEPASTEKANGETSTEKENAIPEESTGEPEADDEVVTDTLYIYDGLTPAEVSQKLKNMGIIKNSVELELFLAQPEYATTIQKGQFELNSSMSTEQIANIITGKKQNE